MEMEEDRKKKWQRDTPCVCDMC